jgi:ribose 1,5-bisphosphate isomerase
MSDPENATAVVTAFLRHDSEVLLCRRGGGVGTYHDRWAGVSGYAEGDPDAQVRAEIREETGLDPETDATLVRSGHPLPASDEEGTWTVHPYLFDVATREVTPNDEHAECEWVPATEILRRDCVPELWATYRRVAPSVRSVTADDEHGSAYCSLRALEVLRDRAGVVAAEAGEREDAPMTELRDLARRLLEARPSMAALRNRVNRVMASAHDPERVESRANEVIRQAVAADRDAARVAADHVDGEHVVTISRSGTVLDALQAGDPDHVLVAESRPKCEGVTVAETLADDTHVTVCTDAALAHLLATDPVDCVLVGSDTVLPDGRLVNKTGTRALALAAAHEDVPVYAVASTDKVTTDPDPRLESGAPSAVYDGDAPIDAQNPTFDVTPADCVTVLSEDGELDASDVRRVAEEHRKHAGWGGEE